MAVPAHKQVTAFEFQPFSKRQKQLLTWWHENSPVNDMDMVIAEGSVRSGKTIAMITSFVQWSVYNFTGENFVIAGKTIGSLNRNVVQPMKKILKALGIPFRHNRSENFIVFGGNTYYLFGGKDEASQDTVQGLTAAGAMFDEVTLMPESFVSQACARCSVEGSKMFFNCNPEGPYHWFRLEFICKAKEKLAVVLHFVMDDNLTISEKTKERYKRMYSGIFYKRFILGLWVMADGIVYEMFRENLHVIKDEQLPDKFDKIIVGIDYGAGNPTVFLKIGIKGPRFYIYQEYYHDARKTGIPKTDGDYSRDYANFMNGDVADDIYYDPSALHLFIQMRQDGIENMKQAKNDVNNGISIVSTLLSNGNIFIHERCVNTLVEITSYAWDSKAAEKGKDAVIKQYDHAMDALRYAIFTYYLRYVAAKRRQERRTRKRPDRERI